MLCDENENGLRNNPLVPMRELPIAESARTRSCLRWPTDSSTTPWIESVRRKPDLRSMNAIDEQRPGSLHDLETRWSARMKYWARTLGRLRLGVEPIEDQLTRYRRVTWLLTAVPGFLSTFLFCLFAVFRRPDIGLFVAALLFLPIVLGAWFGYFLLERRGRRYLAELADYQWRESACKTKSPAEKNDLGAGSASHEVNLKLHINSSDSERGNRSSPRGTLTDACANEGELVFVLINVDRVRPFVGVGDRALELNL